MHYDIAAKRLMEIGGLDILRNVAKIDVRQMDVLDELPQEQTSVTRSDFAVRCTLADGSQIIVLLEFQTDWLESKMLDMVIYAAQRMQRHDLPVVQVMILLRPSGSAKSRFERGRLTYEFDLVKLWELPAEALLNARSPGLWPLAALAQNGLASAGKIDTLLHESPLLSRERSDLLTIFAIFLGMRDVGIAQHFISKRRELMIESPVYDLIRNEGLSEGLDEGHRRGVRGSILDILLTRFGTVSARTKGILLGVVDDEKLLALNRKAFQCATLAEFEETLK